jgi:hypothetical protein
MLSQVPVRIKINQKHTHRVGVPLGVPLVFADTIQASISTSANFENIISNEIEADSSEVGGPLTDYSAICAMKGTDSCRRNCSGGALAAHDSQIKSNGKSRQTGPIFFSRFR